MRKTATVTITEEGRDQGKMFFLTEMSARAAEDWAMRAFLALAKAEVEIPEDVGSAGMAGIAVLGLKMLGKMNVNEARPLLDDMLACVKIIRDPKHPDTVFQILDTDIEEVRTLLQLRAEVFTLHTGFSVPGFRSTNSEPEISEQPRERHASQSTATSRARSAR